MMWWGDPSQMAWGITGMVMMAVFWIGILAVVWLAVVRLSDRGRDRPDGPEEILKTRLARGEITPEEYRRLRDELRS